MSRITVMWDHMLVRIGKHFYHPERDDQLKDFARQDEHTARVERFLRGEGPPPGASFLTDHMRGEFRKGPR